MTTKKNLVKSMLMSIATAGIFSFGLHPVTMTLTSLTIMASKPKSTVSYFRI